MRVRVSYTCTMRGEVEGLQGTSFQSLLTTLPIKLGGLGLRSQVQLSPAAWVGGLEQALPSFGGEKGICPALGELSGAGQDELHRWLPLLDSGLPTGAASCMGLHGEAGEPDVHLPGGGGVQWCSVGACGRCWAGILQCSYTDGSGEAA